MSVCVEHSGLKESINILKKSDDEQWAAIGELRKEDSRSLIRLNVLIIEVALAFITALITIAIK